jgi:hypothetical protein
MNCAPVLLTGYPDFMARLRICHYPVVEKSAGALKIA